MCTLFLLRAKATFRMKRSDILSMNNQISERPKIFPSGARGLYSKRIHLVAGSVAKYNSLRSMWACILGTAAVPFPRSPRPLYHSISCGSCASWSARTYTRDLSWCQLTAGSAQNVRTRRGSLWQKRQHGPLWSVKNWTEKEWIFPKLPCRCVAIVIPEWRNR